QIASSPNSKLIMMPLESSQLIGSIAGIGDIVKQVQHNLKG
ncbi:MAG: SPFH/Band 7/PHB domain protein, partial [Moraxellaceae bacterium]|nr:SPFH/Band 7/PHB domain protein [Moraxellaceae bacterium]